MSNQFFARIATGVTAVILFGGTAYLGYRFIQDVRINAEKIESNIASHPSGAVMVNDATLSGNASAVHLFSDGSGLAWQSAPDGVSNGQDVVVSGGDFAYRHGAPLVRLSLTNRGVFRAGGVFVKLQLFLDGNQTPVGGAVVLPATFEHALAAGKQIVIALPVADAAWRTHAVANAKTRRVVAQVVGVRDADSDDADYPQIGAAVLLRQVANDWSSPADTDEVLGVSLREAASEAYRPSPNIAVTADMPPQTPQTARLAEQAPVRHKGSEDISEFLEKPLPTGEPRILSVQVQEFKDGELMRSTAVQDKE